MATKKETKTYILSLHGYGCQGGIQKLTSAQFDYWRKQGEIDKALSSDAEYDHVENGTPEKAIIAGIFWDKNETLDFSGLLLGNQMADVMIEVTDDQGISIIDETIDSLNDKIQVQDEFPSCTEETEEFYFEHDVPKGSYLWWTRSGTGLWFTGNITLPKDEPFDITALKFLTIDFEGEAFIHKVAYKDVTIMNEGYEQSWSEPTFSYFKSETTGLKNKKLKFALY